MNKNRKLNARRKALHIAVAAALPALMIGGNAHAAGNNPCTVTGSVVNCSSYNGQSGALMVTPSNYNAVNLNGDNPTSKTVVGLASADGNANINTPLSVSNPTTLNIGASSTIVTGLVDLVTGLPSPNATLYLGGANGVNIETGVLGRIFVALGAMGLVPLSRLAPPDVLYWRDWL